MKSLSDAAAREERARIDAIDAQRHEEAVEAEQQRQAEELAKRAEQEERGANAVHPAIREKWEGSQKVDGMENEIVLPNGERVEGRYMLVESGAATPSHDARNGFAKSEGFPVDENGNTVNDRDYERDADAQRVTRDMASKYDGRALQSVPVVSKDGVVLSGNGRTMAGDIAAAEGTDAGYIETLKKYPQQFGFTREQVEGMEHPRVVFVAKEDMPYTAETFAKFNQQDMKSQSRTEQSVKMGKLVDDNAFGRIVRRINGFDTLGEFYNDEKACAEALQELYKAGAINDMQLAEMRDGDKLSAVGRQMLENMLVGKAFDGNPDAIRMLSEYPSMRQRVITALGEIANNKKLGEDYSLEKELAESISLAYQARKSGVKDGDAVSGYALQTNIFTFDDGETVADYENATMLMLADLLNGRETNKLKNTIALYNDSAKDAAAGQVDMFSGDVRSKEEILKDVLNTLNYGNRKDIESRLNEAAEQRKQRAAGEEEAGSVQQDDAAQEGDGAGREAAEVDGSKEEILVKRAREAWDKMVELSEKHQAMLDLGMENTEDGKRVAKELNAASAEHSRIQKELASIGSRNIVMGRQASAENIEKIKSELEGKGGAITGVKEPTETYTTAKGNTVQYTLFDLNGNRGEEISDRGRGNSDDDTSHGDVQRKGSRGSTTDPTRVRLRKLEPGEFCKVERVYSKSKQFEFTSGVNKVESYEDVAYIFKQLETSSIENTFAVLVKDGHPTVVHLGMGTFDSSPANLRHIVPLFNDMNPDAVFMVHNHPSGALKESPEDRNLWKQFSEAFGDKFKDGIIIDTFSGKFATFNYYDHDIRDEKGVSENEKAVNVYAFDTQKYVDKSERKRISNAMDVAEFVSTQRLGSREKMSALIVNNQMRVTGNVHLPYNKIEGNEKEIARELSDLTIRMGGTGAILYGNNLDGDYSRNVAQYMEKQGVRLIDAINVESDVEGSPYGSYKSWKEIGVLEPEGKYDGNDLSRLDQGAGEERSRSERGDGDVAPRYSVITDEDSPFYSNAGKAVKDIKQEKATPEQWLAMLQKNGGLKAGEDKWIGLSEWLRGQQSTVNGQRKTLTKDEVLDYIAKNKIEIEEVEYGKNDDDVFTSGNMIANYSSSIARGLINGVSVEESLRLLDKEFGTNTLEAYKDGKFTVDDLGNIITSETPNNPINNTRLHYTTEGLENKREIALVVPTVEPYNESDEVHFGDAGNGRAVAWVRFGDASTIGSAETTDAATSKRLDAARKAYNDYDSQLRNKYGAPSDSMEDFEKLVLAMTPEENAEWSRLAKEADAIEEDILSKSKKRVLVIDEIQSKRHQDGREKGYNDNKANSAAFREYTKLMEQKYGDTYIRDMSNEEMTEYERLEKQAYKGTANAVPDAPFDKNWHELAMKRMLRYAAENGYDKVAWTTGAQQSERYGLAKQVDKIIYKKTEDGKYNIFALVGGRGITIAKGIEENNLKDYVGESIAKKVIQGEGDDMSVAVPKPEGYDGWWNKTETQKALSGEDLKVGGEGMKGFYDQMLPKFMDKYGKKWGVKTADVTLDLPNESDRVMHSVDVTPEMKESVMEGQPMFSDVKEDDGIYNVEGYIPRKAERATEEAVSRYDKENGTEMAKFIDFMRGGRVVPRGGRVYFHVGNTGELLNEYGINGNIIIGSKAVNPNQHTNNADHRLTVDEWFSAISSLNVPLAISEYIKKNKEGEVVVKEGSKPFRIYTEVSTGSKVVCLGVDVNRADGGVEVTKISTGFGRNLANAIENEGKENNNEKFVYPDAEKRKLIVEQFSYQHNPGGYEQQSVSDGKITNIFGTGKENVENNSSTDENEHVSFSLVKDERLHDEVRRKGVKEIAEDYDKVLDDVYAGMGRTMKERMSDEVGSRFLGDYSKSYDEYRRDRVKEMLGDLAEKPFEDFSDEEQRLWNNVRRVVRDAVSGNGAFNLADNELRYMLWRDKMGFEEGNMGPIEIAQDITKRMELGLDDDGTDDDPNGGVRYSTVKDDELGDIWKDGSMGMQERVTASAARLAHMNENDSELRSDALNAIGGNLMDLRRAVSIQKAFDKSTAKRVADLARVLIQEGYMDVDELKKGDVKRLMSAVKNSVGKEDLSEQVNRVMDIMIDSQLSRGERLINKLTSIKGGKVDARGVEVQGKLDAEGQEVMKAFKLGRKLDADALEERLSSAMDDMGSDDKVLADQARREYIGLSLARDYVENIKGNLVNEALIKTELGSASRKTDADIEYIKSLEEKLMENKIERVQAYNDLIENMSEVLGGSMERAKMFKEEQIERIREIQHNANSDLEGKKADMFISDSRVKNLAKEANNALANSLLAPLGTFEQMLRQFGSKSANGEGYLYNRFMRGWVDAAEKEWTGSQEKYKILDEKVHEVFGKDFKNMKQLIHGIGKMPKMEVAFMDGKQKKVAQMNQGNLMYIYMVDKMADGRMKLRKMGITEEDVEKIKNFLDPRLRQLADWMQEEFLVDTRKEYNETHKRLFGASMAAIENYFPLKVNKAAVQQTEESLSKQQDGKEQKTISTKTGSIVKRRVNNKPLDILNANALEVILDHVGEMEHWNAFAEYNRDLNTLRTYNNFRNKVRNMTTAYGNGDKLLNKFDRLCELAVGEYNPRTSDWDKAITNVAKGVTAAKVSFRIFTAMKQLLSMPAYFGDVRADYFATSLANPREAFLWAKENLPLFDKRWSSRMAGDPRLLRTEVDWKGWRNNVVEIASKIGMSPNALVDAITVSIGAHAVYKTRLNNYKKMGYSEAEAEKRAKQDATIAFNQTQQSSENAFLSTMQVDRSWASTMFTIFRNSSMAYTRQLFDATRNLSRNIVGFKNYDDKIAYMAKQYERDGIDPEQAEANARKMFWKQNGKDLVRVGIFGYVLQYLWNLSTCIPYLLLGNNDDEKQKMLDEVAAKSKFGFLEGVAGGDVISEAGKMLAMDEFNADYAKKDMPLTSDLYNTIGKFQDGYTMEGINDIVNLAVQVGVGVNPQSIEDFFTGIVDACGDDPKLAHESAIMIMRMINAPQSQIDKLMLDEIDLGAKEASKYTPKQLAERYAIYKTKRNTFASMDWDDEKSMGKEQKRITSKIKERAALQGGRALNDEYEEIEKQYKEIHKEANKQEDDVKYAQFVLDSDEKYGDGIVAKVDDLYEIIGDMDKLAKAYLNSETPEEAAEIMKTAVEMKKGFVEASKQSIESQTYKDSMKELYVMFDKIAGKYGIK